MSNKHCYFNKKITETKFGVAALFFILFSVESGLISIQKITFQQVIGITLYNILAPILIVAVLLGIVLMMPIFEIDRLSFIYVILITCLIALIVLMEIIVNGSIPVVRVAGHTLALGTASVFAILIQNIEPRRLFIFMIIAVSPVIIMDAGAILGVVSLHEASPILPGFDRGGIGIKTSFGAHGIVVFMGIFSLIGIIPSIKRLILRIGGIGLAGVVVYIIPFSQSRSTIVGFIFGAVVLLGFFVSRNKTLIDKIIRWTIPIAAVTIWVFSVRLIEARVSSLNSRIRQIDLAIQILQKRPLGIGWDQFENYSTHILHNTELNYFVAGGIPLGTLFFVIIGYPLVAALRAITNATSPDWPLYILLAMYTGINIELLLFKSTPSVQLMIVGVLVCWRAHSVRNT